MAFYFLLNTIALNILEQFELILEEHKLEEAVAKLISYAGDTKVFAFHAAMGTGKTTFIKAICRALGVNENMSSPTYSIVNEYHTTKGEKIYHFDLYRLKTPDECMDIGLEEYVESGAYCFIEWPEIAEELILTKFLIVLMEVKENVRYLRASKN